MGTISIRTKILLALALPLLTAVILLGWGASRFLDSPETDVRNFLLVGSGVMIGVSVLAALLAWRAIRPLQFLASDAQAVVDVRLPALLDRMRSADGAQELRLARIEVSSRDEIGQLAESFNQVQAATVGMAVDQAALLRRGIGDLFVELSKRNQDLLRSQIAFIDELEANEEDPDQLESLFHLDHLATRMQRNAESLLVLAGHESDRPSGEPIELHDVVRLAQGEVEGFSRVFVGNMVEASVDSRVGVDLAHLVAELLENATMYSPPETTVSIATETNGSAVAITIVDAGPGMSPDALRTANELLAHPPLIGLSGATNLGWSLVSRLAHRHDVHVELRPAGESGVRAIVALPGDLLLGRPEAPHAGPEAPGHLLFEPDSDDEPTDAEPGLPEPEPWTVDEPGMETLPDVPSQPQAPTPTTDGRDAVDSTAVEPVVTDEAEPLPTRTPVTETDAVDDPGLEDDMPVQDETAAADIEHVDEAGPEPLPTRTPVTETDAVDDPGLEDDMPVQDETAAADIEHVDEAGPEPLPPRPPSDAPPPTDAPAMGDVFADADPFAPPSPASPDPTTDSADDEASPVHRPVPAEEPDVPFGSLSADHPAAGGMASASNADTISAGEGDDPGITAAGLARRPTPTPPSQPDEAQRSPEALRELLSRYRSGLDKGRTGDHEVAQETDQ